MRNVFSMILFNPPSTRNGLSTSRLVILKPTKGPDKQKPRILYEFEVLQRRRDSNPRNLAVQRFSRPPHSTALPLLYSSQLIQPTGHFGSANVCVSLFLPNLASNFLSPIIGIVDKPLLDIPVTNFSSVFRICIELKQHNPLII